MVNLQGLAASWSGPVSTVETPKDIDHDVVLLDLKLRNEHGADLFNSGGHLTHAPIIIVSAQPSAECRATATRVRAHAVLQKPYAPTDLLLVIGEAVGQPKKAARNH